MAPHLVGLECAVTALHERGRQAERVGVCWLAVQGRGGAGGRGGGLVGGGGEAAR